MKYFELEQIATYLSGFKRIFALERVDDMIIKFNFDNHSPIYADLKRGSATWFMCHEYKKQKLYKAPFDILLHKYFSRAFLEKVEVERGNRILSLHVKSTSHYKTKRYTLSLEFTGRNTNAIILDCDGIVLEALRHIDRSVSFRAVNVGEKLLSLPPRDFKENRFAIEDIPAFLKEVYEQTKIKNLQFLQAQKLSLIAKKLKKLQKEYTKLDDEATLMSKAQRLNENGSLVLANLGLIEPYMKQIELCDFSGKQRMIIFPKEARTPQHASNMLFSASKKCKQKAKSIHVQKENLEEKICFLENLSYMVQNATSADELQILVPKQQNRAKKDKNSNIYETFFIEGYKVMIGKSQKSNIELLKVAKKSDIWLHLKDIPSSHVIIKTDKQQIPQNVLEFAAKLCVNFSKVKAGAYLVDYTKRNNVRIDNGANVHYVDFKSIKVSTEGTS